MTRDELITAIGEMTVLELADLVKALEEKFGEMCIRDRGMEYAQRLSDEELLERLEALRINGAIRVPKEYGMFRARAGVC